MSIGDPTRGCPAGLGTGDGQRAPHTADAADLGFWTLELASGVLWASERARIILGLPPDGRLTLAELEAAIHREDRDEVHAAVERSTSTGAPFDLEHRLVARDGADPRRVASRACVRRGAGGEPEGLLGICVDLTERAAADAAVRKSDERSASGAELAGLGYYEVDFVEGVAYTDARFREICGISAEDEGGLGALQAWIERLHPDDRQRVLEVRRQLHDGELEQVSAEYRFMTPRDGQKWIHHLGRVSERDAAGQARITFGVLRDITARKHAEEELSDLGRRLMQAHEEERALLARELHDDLTQRLAVLAIDVGRIELASPDPALTAAMRAMREELVRLSEDVHSLAYQLHPSVLDELGLVEALRAECERRRRRLDIELALDCDALPAVVGKQTALCLFRVAQEALNNVVRHAGGRAASVFLRQVDGGLLLVVRDDGVGFDPASLGKGKHLGLLSMRERVRLVGGTLDIESASGRGTSISAWVPTRGGP